MSAKIKTIIIDDEKQARNSLLSDLKKHASKLEIIGEADSVESAVKLIDSIQPNLIFLDINLGDGSGFNVLEKCTYKNFKIIFVTAYDQYAIKAFKVSALHFLLKPVDADELEGAIGRVLQLNNAEQLKDSLTVYKENKLAGETEKKIVLRELDAVHIVKLKELIACEASGIYTTFYINNSKQIVVSKNLKEYEEILESYGFLRVHNSFLINAHKIEKFEKSDGGFLIMEGGQRIPVSQRKRDVVIDFLKNI
jgi:two-component system LytT family response regulator